MARPTAIALFLMLCTPLPAMQHGDNPSSAQQVPTDPRAQVTLPMRLPCPALNVPLVHVQERVCRMGSWWRNCGIRGRVPFHLVAVPEWLSVSVVSVVPVERPPAV